MLIDWGEVVDSVLVVSGRADKGIFFRRVKSGGMVGSGSFMWSLMSMSRTVDMVGRTSGFSCTQSRPTWKHRHASSLEYESPSDGSMNSDARSSVHSFHACPKCQVNFRLPNFELPHTTSLPRNAGVSDDVCTSWMRDCWCSSRYNAPFRCPLKISRRRTPKLNTSDFTEKAPSKANSGAMYPLHCVLQ